MSENYPNGRFVWFDLMTSDAAAARDFYTQLIGWGLEEMDIGGQSYYMWTNEEKSLGGTDQLSEEAAAIGTPPHWLAYVSTEDVDATAAKAVELGGNLMVPPTDIPTVGRFAMIADPQGAVFAIFKSESGPGGSDEMPGVGNFSWHELVTTDYEAAFDFYHQLFGWHKGEAMDMGPAGIYQIYSRVPEVPPLGGMFNKSDDMPMPPSWLYYVRVTDIHAKAEKVKELGGQVVNGPMEVPGGDLIVQCTDPQGGMFALHSTAS